MAVSFVPYSSTPTVTTATAVGGYTTATGVSAVVIGLGIANTSTSTPATVDVIRYTGTTSYFILKGSIVPPGSALTPIGGDAPKITMASGYQIQVAPYATTANLDVTMSVMEIS